MNDASLRFDTCPMCNGPRYVPVFSLGRVVPRCERCVPAPLPSLPPPQPEEAQETKAEIVPVSTDDDEAEALARLTVAFSEEFDNANISAIHLRLQHFVGLAAIAVVDGDVKLHRAATLSMMALGRCLLKRTQKGEL